MSEFTPKSPYSEAARVVTEDFSGSSEVLAEHERRGTIATNNLGLKMFVYEAGPDSEVGRHYSGSLFTDRMSERFERVRTIEPDLWQESVAAYEARTLAMRAFASALRDFGLDDERTAEIEQQVTDAHWHDVELRTRVFRVIEQEPLTVEEAIELCG